MNTNVVRHREVTQNLPQTGDKNWPLARKLVVIGAVVSVLPLAIVGFLGMRSTENLTRTATRDVDAIVYKGLNETSQSIKELCNAYAISLSAAAEHNLNIVSDTAGNQGGFTFDEKNPVQWKAVNQFSQDAQQVSLPQVLLNGKWLGQNRDPNTPTPFIDVMAKSLSSTATVFQRINEKGDMLRVATTILKNNERAIGTYIPATNPDGKPNPVVAQVLAGKDYVGRAFVVDAWYSTGYRPILKDKKVVGMLYVGVPEAKSTAELRAAFTRLRTGKSDYVFATNSTGPFKGKYLFGPGTIKEGDDLPITPTDQGETIKDALGAVPERSKNGEGVTIRYQMKDKEGNIKWKVSRVIHFAPWDWIIGVGALEEDFRQTANKIEDLSSQNQRTQWIVTIVTLVFSIAIWMWVARSMARRLTHSVQKLNSSASEVSLASSQAATASGTIARGASQQAVALEQTTASMSKISEQTRYNAESAHKAADAAQKAQEAASSGGQAMEKMSNAISEIEEAAKKTSAIIKVIDEIAFQTNLLALNAAVEAARAGEAGRGFAVVAEEVRNLAMRSAEAAKNTAEMIQTSVQRAGTGVQIVMGATETLDAINKSCGEVNEIVSQIATASQEQAGGIEQVSKALAEMDRVTQENAAGAEESASVAQEMSTQATAMLGVVRQIDVIVNGSSNLQQAHAAGQHA